MAKGVRTLGSSEGRLLLTLASQGKEIFTTAEALAVLGDAPHRVNKLLAGLTRKR